MSNSFTTRSPLVRVFVTVTLTSGPLPVYVLMNSSVSSSSQTTGSSVFVSVPQTSSFIEMVTLLFSVTMAMTD